MKFEKMIFNKLYLYQFIPFELIKKYFYYFLILLLSMNIKYKYYLMKNLKRKIIKKQKTKSNKL
jgi:hypothetical protein